MERIDFESTPEGVILPVQAHPGAKKNELKGIQNGMLKVSVTQVPERGKANKAITEFLAKGLKLRKSQVEILSGETAGKKRFLIREMTEEELQRRIEISLG